MLLTRQSLKTIENLYQAGKFEEAEQKMLPFLYGDVSFPLIRLAAQIARDKGEPGRALEFLRNGLQLKPDDYEMLVILGTVYDRINNPLKADAAYSTAINTDPEKIEARLRLALSKLNSQDAKSALLLLDDLYANSPNNRLIAKAYIIALKECARSEKALEVLSSVDVDWRQQSDLIYLEGQIYFQLGRFDDAIEKFLKTLLDAEFGSESIKNIAQILSMRGATDKLEKFTLEMTRNRELAPSSKLALARVMHATNQTREATKILSEAQNRDEISAEMLAFLGRISADSGDGEKAFELTLEALKKQPGDLALMADFARAALLSGHVNDAMYVAEQALKAQPDNQFWMAIRATGGRLLGTDYKFYFNYPDFVKAFRIEPPKGYASIEEFNEALAQRLEAIHQFSGAPLDQSVRAGVQTSPNLIYLEDPVLKSFFDAVQAPINAYLNSIGFDPVHPLKRRNTGKARICSAWSVKLGEGGHHVDHIHPEGWISSSYYVRTPEEIKTSRTRAGWIRFGKPPLELGLGAEHFIQPEAGTLVLFPSYLWHGTVPLTKSDERITLPFDILPVQH